MADYRTTIGNVEIASLSDGRLRFATSDFFPDIEAKQWDAYRSDLSPEGDLLMNMGCFLLRSDGKTVLVDTGLGLKSYDLDALETGLLHDEFRAKGINPDDVDMVMITHLHRDHVGWNFTPDGDGWRPTFPNAKYYVPETDWRIFTRRAGMERFSYIREQVLPLEELGLLELMDGEQVLTSELTAMPTPGHTPGHTSLLISSSGEKAIVVGDASHVPAQAQETHWSPRADSKPDVSAETRKKLMDRIEADNAVLVSGHYPAPGYGRLIRLEGRRYWKALD
jgi:glyoxylase-like metal-dependent hydrolase (beta-lactamase superfamily II)